MTSVHKYNVHCNSNINGLIIFPPCTFFIMVPSDIVLVASFRFNIEYHKRGWLRGQSFSLVCQSLFAK